MQTAMIRREVKGKEEKERDTHLNAEVQRITRRDKKAFLSDQCKEIEENNRMGKTRDLFKKIRDTKGRFHAKMGTMKDRNGMDLTETENIKKRWQEYTEELQRRERRDKKAFLGDQCKEIEENNRMGNTRDLFKKIRNTKGIFHANMGTIKDKNGVGLTEAEDIKKRWQEYTNCTKKIFTTQIITMV